MTWTYTLLRGGDDLDAKPFEPVTSGAVALVDSTGESGVTAETVLQKLASRDATFGLAVQEGSTVERYDAATSAWVDDNPTLSFGPMLVREIAVVEHPDNQDLWRVEFQVSGFGPVMSSGNTIGSVQISVGVVTRPRMAPAYRCDVATPADVLSSGAFTEAPWINGNDIGGKSVDINTSPVSIPIDQTVITIQTVKRTPFQDWTAAWVGPDGSASTLGLEAIADDWVGGRNSDAFMGFPIGSLLMESVELQPLHHEFKTQTMTLIYDQWHHANQMPLVNPQFNIPTTPNATTAMSHTTTVLWNQTFWDAWEIPASGAPFFGTAEMDYLTTVFV